MSPFSGDFFAPLQNLTPVVIVQVAIYELCTVFGLTWSSAQVCMFAAISHQVMAQQIVSSENDLAVCGLFLACLAYGSRYATNARAQDLVFASLAFGLLSGVKYYALGYACCAASYAALATFFLAGWKCGRRTGRVVAGFFCLGSYWYVRNAILGWEPALSGGPHLNERLDGERLSGNRAPSFLGNRSHEIPGLLLAAVFKLGGPCYLLALLAMPLAIVSQCGFWVRDWYCRDQIPAGTILRICLLLAVIQAAFVFLLTPFAAEDAPGSLNQLRDGYCPFRYGLSAFTLMLVAAAVAIEDVNTEISGRASRRGRPRALKLRATRAGAAFGFRPVLLGLVGLLAVWQLTVVLSNTRLSLVISIWSILAILVLLYFGAPAWRWLAVLSAGIGSVGLVTLEAAAASRTWHEGYVEHFDGNSAHARSRRLMPTSAQGPEYVFSITFHTPTSAPGGSTTWSIPCNPLCQRGLE